MNQVFRIWRQVFRIGRNLPVPMQRLIKGLQINSVVSGYYARVGWPLSKPLTGCRMVGSSVSGYALGGYEEDVVRTILRLVQPGWTCADVGAHQGYFTLLLGQRVGDAGRVIAFEAHPENASLIRRNVDLNGLQKRACVENIAVTDGVQPSVTLYAGRAESSAEWNIMGHDVAGHATRAILQIPGISLDHYFRNGKPLNFVKMGIEGAEALALVGMRSVLRQQRPVLVVEFHDAAAWAARTELVAAGYDLYALEDGQQKLKDPVDEARAYHCVALPQLQAS